MPVRLKCPACSSHGVNPSQEQHPFDKLFRIFGRAPYDCIWCGRRCFLVPSDKERGIQNQANGVIPPDSPPLPPAPADENRDLKSVATAVVQPEPMMPIPSPIVQPGGVPNSPMYAEKGRLRLSKTTLDQIQWRGENGHRVGVVSSNGKRPKS